MKIDPKKLKMARAMKGWTITKLAEESGVSRRALSFIENGRTTNVRMDNILRITEALGIKLSEIEETEIFDVKTMNSVISDVMRERASQFINFGNQKNSPGEWLAIAVEEIGEMAQAIMSDKPWSKETDSDNLYEEIIQGAAVLVQWAESIKKTGREGIESAKK